MLTIVYMQTLKSITFNFIKFYLILIDNFYLILIVNFYLFLSRISFFLYYLFITLYLFKS